MLSMIHPGVFFKEEVIDTRAITDTQIAECLDIPIEILDGFISGRIDCDSALAERIAEITCTTKDFWLSSPPIHFPLDKREKLC